MIQALSVLRRCSIILGDLVTPQVIPTHYTRGMRSLSLPCLWSWRVLLPAVHSRLSVRTVGNPVRPSHRMMCVTVWKTTKTFAKILHIYKIIKYNARVNLITYPLSQSILSQAKLNEIVQPIAQQRTTWSIGHDIEKRRFIYINN